jgi:hypothetical protein
MKMNFKNIYKLLLFTFFAFAIYSCDKDFNTIGANVVEDDHFGFTQYFSDVVAVNKNYNSIQTNNLPVNALGIYNNPVFGKTRANFVTQLELENVNPIFDPFLQPTSDNKCLPTTQVVLDSVILSVPYFSTRTAVDADGKGTYTLDSIQGNTPINLKIFENKFLLTNLDPNSNFQDSQKYFSNQDNNFNSFIGPQINFSDEGIALNSSFLPDNKEIPIKKLDDNLAVASPTVIEARLSPRLRIKIKKQFFFDKIINAPKASLGASAPNLATNEEFKKYFRGLYFQVADAADGNLTKMNFAQGDITLYWKQYSGVKDDATAASGKSPVLVNGQVRYAVRSLVLKMRGTTINLIEQTNSPNYTANRALIPNTTVGDDKLWIKGGANGSVAYIDLFGKDLFGSDGVSGSPNGVADELDMMRTKKWLINEANLVFTVDKSIMPDEISTLDFYKRINPYRLYLYDAEKNTPILDYSFDNTTGISPKFNKLVLGGFLQKNATTGSYTYKIRITNHIRNLINNTTSVNVKLGLSVNEFIGFTSNTFLDLALPAKEFKPVTSTINQKGTVLHGSNPSANDKRLKLEIYYTKPN